MKIFSTTLLISFMTVFAASAHAGSDGSEDGANPQVKPRLANSQDLINAGYRRGLADAQARALENTASGSSSVTTPLSYRKPVYVQAPSTQPRVRSVTAPEPRKLPNYVQRIQPKVQPTVPNMQPKRQTVQRVEQTMRHANHGHHNQSQIIDCELTDSLNRAAGPVTTVLSTQKYYRPVAQPRQQLASARQHRVPARKPAPMKRIANLKHDNHYHHTNAQRADCALTDSLNRGGSITRVVRKY